MVRESSSGIRALPLPLPLLGIGSYRSVRSASDREELPRPRHALEAVLAPIRELDP